MALAATGPEGSICGERASLEDEGVQSDGVDSTESSTPNSKRVRHPKPPEETISWGTKLDEGSWSALDEPLKEKIIARLPFKSLFQAASLSKAWRLNFRFGSFQSEVHSSSATSWQAYSPLYVNHTKDLVGYESSSESWQVLPNLSYLRQDLVEDWCLWAGAGSLLCWISAPRFNSMHRNEAYHVHVTNPLTKSWRQLPSRPQMQTPRELPDLVHVVCEGTEAYKVMLVTVRSGICVQTFDSNSGAWTMEDTRCIFSPNYSCDGNHGSALIHGVLYTTVVNSSGYQLVSFDVADRVWKEFSHLCKDGDNKSHQRIRFSDHNVRFSQVLVCGCNVMQVVAHWEFDFDHPPLSAICVISVFKLDLEHGLAVEVSRAPEDMLDMEFDLNGAAGHGDCIYIGSRYPSCPSIFCNVMTQEWRRMNSPRDKLRTSFRETFMNEWLWTSISYQPGLNPFLKV